MARGDHLVVRCTGFTHHGIDAGDGTVIHYIGADDTKVDPIVRRTGLRSFSGGEPIQVLPYAWSLPVDEVMRRAESRLGERSYSLVANNCEHFARWCRIGEAHSGQVWRSLVLSLIHI